MIPLTGGVLVAAAVVAAPALWGAAVEGTLPLDEALTRFLVAVAVCWLVLAVVVDLTFPSSGPARPHPDEAPLEQDRLDG